MKKRGAALFTAVFVCFVLSASSSYSYTISLTRNSITNFASALLVLEGMPSDHHSALTPYAEASVGDENAGPFVYSGRGLYTEEVEQGRNGDIEWSTATIRLGGESRYSLTAPEISFFPNSAVGLSSTVLNYDLKLESMYGSTGPVVVSIDILYLNYASGGGWDSPQSITLKGTTFSWNEEFGSIGGENVNLTLGQPYVLSITSIGDISNTILKGEEGRSGSFESSVEMRITAQELGIPLPPSILLLGASLVCAFVFRKKLLLS